MDINDAIAGWITSVIRELGEPSALVPQGAAFTESAARLRAVHEASQQSTSGWTGPDADAYEAAMREHADAVTEAATLLETTGAKVDDHASKAWAIVKEVFGIILEILEVLLAGMALTWLFSWLADLLWLRLLPLMRSVLALLVRFRSLMADFTEFLQRVGSLAGRLGERFGEFIGKTLESAVIDYLPAEARGFTGFYVGAAVPQLMSGRPVDWKNNAWQIAVFTGFDMGLYMVQDVLEKTVAGAALKNLIEGKSVTEKPVTREATPTREVPATERPDAVTTRAERREPAAEKAEETAAVKPVPHEPVRAAERDAVPPAEETAAVTPGGIGDIRGIEAAEREIPVLAEAESRAVAFPKTELPPVLERVGVPRARTVSEPGAVGGVRAGAEDMRPAMGWTRSENDLPSAVRADAKARPEVEARPQTELRSESRPEPERARPEVAPEPRPESVQARPVVRVSETETRSVVRAEPEMPSPVRPEAERAGVPRARAMSEPGPGPGVRAETDAVRPPLARARSESDLPSSVRPEAESRPVSRVEAESRSVSRVEVESRPVSRAETEAASAPKARQETESSPSAPVPADPVVAPPAPVPTTASAPISPASIEEILNPATVRDAVAESSAVARPAHAEAPPGRPDARGDSEGRGSTSEIARQAESEMRGLPSTAKRDGIHPRAEEWAKYAPKTKREALYSGAKEGLNITLGNLMTDAVVVHVTHHDLTAGQWSFELLGGVFGFARHGLYKALPMGERWAYRNQSEDGRIVNRWLAETPIQWSYFTMYLTAKEAAKNGIFGSTTPTELDPAHKPEADPTGKS
ncbi:hypothetical protein SAMN05216251_115102 [Actinacidiphila alni]|uniref:Uncharacterized protein n=1 Tax=Actinacidiphila alni TaxID=380248 RepID=A0A1I2IXL7_9ACTN|nr:hypothetical protein [Actinacidiphila alni]SFF47242.1 hypothetical protein SAMN05216251_115102 [Actinacidiphila alni]